MIHPMFKWHIKLKLNSIFISPYKLFFFFGGGGGLQKNLISKRTCKHFMGMNQHVINTPYTNTIEVGNSSITDITFRDFFCNFLERISKTHHDHSEYIHGIGNPKGVTLKC